MHFCHLRRQKKILNLTFFLDIIYSFIKYHQINIFINTVSKHTLHPVFMIIQLQSVLLLFQAISVYVLHKDIRKLLRSLAITDVIQSRTHIPLACSSELVAAVQSDSVIAGVCLQMNFDANTRVLMRYWNKGCH